MIVLLGLRGLHFSRPFAPEARGCGSLRRQALIRGDAAPVALLDLEWGRLLVPTPRIALSNHVHPVPHEHSFKHFESMKP
jgi:hypothetical protein